MNKNNKTIFIAGGGTGGHLFPAVAIGKTLEERGINVFYIGSKNGIEKKYFNQHNLKHFLLNISGIQRNFNMKSILKNLTFPIKFILSYLKSVLLILKYKPKAIVGTGGYCSGLPLIAGITLKIPTFIQDQNSIPGLITRTLHNKIDNIFLGYKNASKHLNKDKCIFSGNPVREDLIISDKELSKNKLNFNPAKKLLFIIGGSQGAKPINDYFLKNYKNYISQGYQILLQCGEKNIENFNEVNNPDIKIVRFIDNISLAYSASDIVISRAGALAISELCIMKKAIILIPFPEAAENHQKVNAEYLQNQNACKIIYQNELKSDKLLELVKQLFKNESEITKLEKNSTKISKKDSTKVITDKIIEHMIWENYLKIQTTYIL